MRLTQHARARLEERGLTRGDVRRIIRQGKPDHLPAGKLLWIWAGRGVLVYGKTVITVW